MLDLTGGTRWLVTIAALALVAIPAGQASSALTIAPRSDTASVPSTDHLCNAAVRIRKGHTADLSRVADEAVVTISGRDFALDSWQGFTDEDPTVSQYFHSSSWLVPLYDDDSALAVSLLLDQAGASPDPGASAGLQALRSTGWSEYLVTLRLWTGLCLYSRSSDPRLVPVLGALITANLDEMRYYGPPRRPPHNHGVFANEVLRAAGVALGRPELVDRASQRLHEMFERVFEPCGMVREQSSFYQALNIRLWTRNLGPDASTADQAVLDRARLALGALIRPDGVLEPIGDGVAGAWTPDELRAVGASAGGSAFCPETGWAAAHVSAASGDRQHHVVRFGPSTRMHGHADHGAPTWWIAESGQDGVPVLVDRGLYDNSADARRRWADSAEAHSVLRLAGEDIGGSTRGEDLGGDHSTAYRLTTSTRRGSATRVLTFDHSSFALGASDSFRVSSGPAARLLQSWHLGPDWVRSDIHTAVTRDGTHTLDVFCQADGSLAPPVLLRVEHFPAYRTAVDALVVRCRAPRDRDTLIETILVVDEPGARARVAQGHLAVETSTRTYGFDAGGRLTVAVAESPR